MEYKKKCSATSFFGLFVSIAISVIFICITFNRDFVFGHSLYWMREGTDVGQHVSGIAMYLSSAWQFPLLAFDSLNYPEGTRITFLDGVPLYALLLKIFLPKHLGFFNPLGYWVALCFILQAVGAWWITRELEIKSWIYLLFLVSVFLLYPAFIMRLKHAALLSHWLILFSIALYFRGKRLQHFSVIGWTLLLFSSFYIHVYLFAMALGIYIASIIEAGSNFSFRQIFLMLISMMVLVASLFLLLLPLPSFSLIREIGFDKYGMSILAPLLGGDIIHWQIGTTYGQKEEGLNYLGLGIIIAFLYAISFHKIEYGAVIKKYRILCIVMFFYFLYALSDHIYCGSKLIAVVSYPKFLNFITGELRCSARFFWPVGYLVIIFSTYVLYHRLKVHAFSFVLCALWAIQLIDLQGYYHQLKTTALWHPYVRIINYAALDKFLGENITHLYVYPKYKCTIEPFRNNVLLSVMRYAAMHNLTVNTGYIARYQPLCNDIQAEILHSNHSQSAYIFIQDEYSNKNAMLSLMGNTESFVCQKIDVVYVCKFNG